MKTAKECWVECTHDLALSNNKDIVISFTEFAKALKEHDIEKDREYLERLNSPDCAYVSKIKIIALIDDMIKPLKEHLIKEEKRLETESPDDIPDISYFEDKGKYKALTELKNKL